MLDNHDYQNRNSDQIKAAKRDLYKSWSVDILRGRNSLIRVDRRFKGAYCLRLQDLYKFIAYILGEQPLEINVIYKLLVPVCILFRDLLSK
jgi:hypothetical protein